MSQNYQLEKVLFSIISVQRFEHQSIIQPKTLLNLNIGKYIAINITPTKTPTIKIIKGSKTVDKSLDFCEIETIMLEVS